MNYTSPLPVDKNGNPVPVFVPATGRTKILVMEAAATLGSLTPIASATKVMSSTTLASVSTDTLIITSKLDGYDGDQISVTVAAGGTAGITVSGKDIVITPASGGTKTTTVKELLDANSDFNKIATCTVNGESNITASQTKRYLTGYDDGKTPTIVRIYNSSEKTAWVGTFPEGNNGTLAASMPIPPYGVEWIAVYPGEYITGKYTTGAVAVNLYLTPGRKY